MFKDFQAIWGDRTATVPAPMVDDVVDNGPDRSDAVRDMRVFIGTLAYREYRTWLDHEIDTMSPDPSMGSDVAACYTFKREGLIASRRRLDAMIRLAEEKLSDG